MNERESRYRKDLIRMFEERKPNLIEIILENPFADSIARRLLSLKAHAADIFRHSSRY